MTDNIVTSSGFSGLVGVLGSNAKADTAFDSTSGGCLYPNFSRRLKIQ